MKVVILAGGMGTRISEESHLRPKPMIEIGEKPILWHIMKIYSSYGFNDFIICCGYKGYIIKEYFADYYLHNSDVVFNFRDDNKMEVLNNASEPWKVTLIDTGLRTETGGRIKRIQKYIGNEPFFLTYGDGVSNVDIDKLLAFHMENGKIATLTAVTVAARYGVLDIARNFLVDSFREKSEVDAAKINGGFFVMNPEIFNYLKDDETVLEKEPLRILATEKNLAAFVHDGFWQCMDTQRDKSNLEALWQQGDAPWKIW